MDDQEIDKYLKEINEDKFYRFKDEEQFENPLEGIKYRENIQYLSRELKLIWQPISHADFIRLSAFGNKIMRLGGWTKYLELEERKERNKERKEQLDLRISAWQAKTGWAPLIIAIIGLGLSIFATYKATEKSNEPQLEKQEIIQEKSNTQGTSMKPLVKDSLNTE